MLQRINQLAVKGENGTLTTVDRGYIKSEVQQLMSEIDRVQSTTTFNEQNLLDGTFTNKGLQVGAEAGQHIDISIKNMNVTTLFSANSNIVNTFRGGAEVSSKDFGSLNTVTKAALAVVSQQRSDLGAVQNRLEHTINNLDNVVENTTAAESQIRDTDMASEMVRYSNNNILAQAGQSMLAQANQSNQGVLSLLG
jgi:flagellin